MNTPIVSVLMPTHEPSPRHLTEALDSLLAQTETRWMLFIHDDASKSDVQSMVKKYMDDPRITFERGEKNLGIGGNWNACLRSVTPLAGRSPKDEDRSPSKGTPYIQFLFQDDRWEPTYLEKAIEILERCPSVGFVSVDHAYRYEGDVPAQRYQELRATKEREVTAGLRRGREFLLWWIRRELHPNVIGEPSFVMLRTELLETVGPFREDMPQFLDVEYWMRCLLRSDWYNLKEELGTFRVHPQAASACNAESGAGIYDRLRCMEQLIASLHHSTLRTEAVAARSRALTDMAEKFFRRLKQRRSVPLDGKGGAFFKKFCLRHPLLVMHAGAKAFWGRR